MEMKQQPTHVEKKYNFRTESARDRFLDWCMKAAPMFESSAPPKPEESSEYSAYSGLSDEYQHIRHNHNTRYNLRQRGNAPRPSGKNPDRTISATFPAPGELCNIPCGSKRTICGSNRRFVVGLTFQFRT